MNHEKIKNVHLDVVSDDLYGNQIIAYIELISYTSIDDILNFCEQYLPKNKLPHQLEIVENIL